MAVQTKLTNQVKVYQEDLKEMAKNPKTILFYFFGTVGVVSVLAQINWGNIGILNTIGERIFGTDQLFFFENVLTLAGKTLRLFLATIIGLVIFMWFNILLNPEIPVAMDYLFSDASPSYAKKRRRQFLTMFMLIFILIWLWVFAPDLLPALFNSGQSILNSIYGGI